MLLQRNNRKITSRSNNKENPKISRVFNGLTFLWTMAKEHPKGMKFGGKSNQYKLPQIKLLKLRFYCILNDQYHTRGFHLIY